ncbi:F-box/kelch-repeat protein At3g06240-like [Argentina anserina]|uniref:F-box/kelch-repeat protein At3g06240-like n=1 Tax=Argentina anserina TaxID=57926 RepID=UPI0021765629|nr:F-box/kelch-repeat protein At3g06240-like [Potentilla anserina]
MGLIGSCDGLVCVKECRRGMFILWNPSTRDYKIIPGSFVVEGEIHGVLRRKYGFGYDCNGDDYKVVTLSCEENTVKKKTVAFVSGALHWVVDREADDMRVIISLDLASKTYIEVPQPDYENFSYLAEVGASRGCLCLLAYDNFDYCDIWVMNKYGVGESWIKSIRISYWLGDERNYLGHLKPLTWFIENGEIVLSIGGNLASYNANRNSVRCSSPRKELPSSMVVFQAIPVKLELKAP